jgi:hypothetical protein
VSSLTVSLSFMSLRLSNMWFKLRMKLACSHSDKCFEIELFCGSECSDNRVAKFLSVLPM